MLCQEMYGININDSNKVQLANELPQVQMDCIVEDNHSFLDA